MVKEMLKNLNAEAEKIRNTDPQSLQTMEVGDEFRQGDVRIKRLSDNFVKVNSSRLEKIPVVSQLAPGNTQGSRHTLANTKGVKMFRLRDASPIDGPVVELLSPNAVMHPEHGDVIDLPAGCYAFPGQREYAQELRRVQD